MKFFTPLKNITVGLVAGNVALMSVQHASAADKVRLGVLAFTSHSVRSSCMKKATSEGKISTQNF